MYICVNMPEDSEKREGSERMPVKKKRELESEPEDRPRPIGECYKHFCPRSLFTSHRHYEKFQFRGTTYGRVSFVLIKIY